MSKRKSLDKVNIDDPKKKRTQVASRRTLNSHNCTEFLEMQELGTLREKVRPEWRATMPFVGAETLWSLGYKSHILFLHAVK